MSDILIDEDDETSPQDDEITEATDILMNNRQTPKAEARRRLEQLLEEKRLRDELGDDLDY